MSRFDLMQELSVAHAGYTRTDGHTEYAFNSPDRAARYIVGGIRTVTVAHDDAMYAGECLNAVFDLSIDSQGAESLGVWHDNGSAYFDLGDTYSRLDLALDIARQRGELAIWDRETETAITV